MCACVGGHGMDDYAISSMTRFRVGLALGSLCRQQLE
jgi:hypothetical protein